MHELMLEAIIKNCRQRSDEGDHPTVMPWSVEQLEEAVVQLADKIRAARIGARLPSNETLRRRIASDPDDEPQAGRDISG